MNFSFRCRLFQEALFSPSLERLCIVFPPGPFPGRLDICRGCVYQKNRTERTFRFQPFDTRLAFSLRSPVTNLAVSCGRILSDFLNALQKFSVAQDAAFALFSA